MNTGLFSRAAVFVFYALSLMLALAITLYRTDFTLAQGDDATETPVALPRATQIADDDDEDGDDDGLDPPTDEDDDDDGLLTFVFTIRQGDTLSHIALYLGVPLESLAAQIENPSLIFPGQQFTYRSERRIDTPPLFTDNDGTDSDGYDTPPPTTDNDGTDSDGYDTPVPTTDNDGTDSDGYDTPPPTTDNDGTDSDGYDTPPPTDDSDDSD